MNYWNPMTEQVEQTDDYCPVCGQKSEICQCGYYDFSEKAKEILNVDEINKNQAEYLD